MTILADTQALPRVTGVDPGAPAGVPVPVRAPIHRAAPATAVRQLLAPVAAPAPGAPAAADLELDGDGEPLAEDADLELAGDGEPLTGDADAAGELAAENRDELEDDVRDLATVGEETVGEESAGEESVGEESAGEETVGEESAGEESAGEESAGEESLGREPDAPAVEPAEVRIRETVSEPVVLATSHERIYEEAMAGIAELARSWSEAVDEFHGGATRGAAA